MLEKIIFGFLILCFASCESFTVMGVNLQIIPYDESDRGKFWNLCVDYNEIGYNEKPKVQFELKVKETGKTRTYIRRLDSNCEKCNVLVAFIKRHTPHSEFKLLKSLEAKDIEYIKVKVLNDNGFIVFSKTFTSRDLM